MPDPRPDEIRTQSFGTALRGFRPEDVRAFLDDLASRVQDLVDERDRLRELADQTGKMDLKSEFDRIGAEVGEVLHAARVAADGIRTRAADDAAMLATKAKAETELALRESEQQSQTLRGDAWEAAEQLLSQALSERDRVREETERERLAMIGRAERDAHRLVANARQESDEMVRQSKMESERLVVDARSRHDEIIEQARSQAETAQERAAALERRRSELLGELESVRAAVSRLETDIQEKREQLEAVEAERETPPEPEPEETVGEWSDAVRLIRRGEEAEPEVVDATDLAEEVRTLRSREAEDDPEQAADTGGSVEEPGADEEAASAPDPKPDQIGSLFASLRGDDVAPAIEDPPSEAAKRSDQSAPKKESKSKAATKPDKAAGRPKQPTIDFDVDGVLLPITNRVLRDIKRQLTEAQNVALDGLRVQEGEWEPDRDDLVDRLGGYLIVVAQESYGAGFASSEEFSGASPGRPRPTDEELGDPATEFTGTLADTLTDAVDSGRQSGQGPRQLSATVSRVYRAWRTDEAERRVRAIAEQAFQAGLTKGLATTDVDAEEILRQILV